MTIYPLIMTMYPHTEIMDDNKLFLYRYNQTYDKISIFDRVDDNHILETAYVRGKHQASRVWKYTKEFNYWSITRSALSP